MIYKQCRLMTLDWVEIWHNLMYQIERQNRNHHVSAYSVKAVDLPYLFYRAICARLGSKWQKVQNGLNQRHWQRLACPSICPGRDYNEHIEYSDCFVVELEFGRQAQHRFFWFFFFFCFLFCTRKSCMRGVDQFNKRAKYNSFSPVFFRTASWILHLQG